MEIVVIKTADNVERTTTERDILYEKIQKELNLSQDVLYALKHTSIAEKTVPDDTTLRLKQLCEYENIILIVDDQGETRHLPPIPTKAIHKKDLNYFLGGDKTYMFMADSLVHVIGIVIDTKSTMTKKVFGMSLAYEILSLSNTQYLYHILCQRFINNTIKLNTKQSDDRYLSLISNNISTLSGALLGLFIFLEVCPFPNFITYASTHYTLDNDICREFKNVLQPLEPNVVEEIHIDRKPSTLEQLLNSRAYMFYGLFCDLYNLSVGFDMMSNNKFDVYQALKWAKMDVNVNWRDEVARKAHQLANARTLWDKYVDEVQYRSVFRDINFERYKKLYSFYGFNSKDIRMNLMYSIKQYLTPEEKKLCELRLQRIETKTQPWDILLRRLSRRVIPRLLQELEQYITAKNDDGFYTHNTYSVICAHLYKLYHGEPIEMLLSTYATSQLGSYYCRICGAFMAKREYDMTVSWEGDRAPTHHVEDEDLLIFVKRYVIGALRGEIEFKAQVQETHLNRMAKKLTEKIAPHVKATKKKFGADRTSSIEQKDAKTKLFTVMYVYTHLMRLYVDNYESMRFKNYLHFGEKPRIDALKSFIVKTINMKQNTLINMIQTMNFTTIAEHINKMYDDLANFKARINVVESVEKHCDRNLRRYLEGALGRAEAKQFMDKKITAASIGTLKTQFKPEEYVKASLLLMLYYLDLPMREQPEYTKALIEFTTSEAAYFAKTPKQLPRSYLHVRPVNRKYCHSCVTTECPVYSKLVAIDFGLKNGFHKHKWTRRDWQLVCSICGSKCMDVVEENKDDALTIAVEKSKNLENFYNFYFDLCPIPAEQNIFHDWANDSCKRCGMTKKDIITMNYATFDKYYITFEKTRKRAYVLLAMAKLTPKIIPPPKKCDITDTTLKAAIASFVNETVAIMMETPKIDITRCILKKKNDYSVFWHTIGYFELNIFEDIINGAQVVKNEQVRNVYLQKYAQYAVLAYKAAMNYHKYEVSTNADLKKVMKTNVVIPNITLHANEKLGITLEEKNMYLLVYIMSVILAIKVAVKNDLFMYYYINLFIQNEKSAAKLTEKERLRSMRGITEEYIDENATTGDEDMYEDMDYDGNTNDDGKD